MNTRKIAYLIAGACLSAVSPVFASDVNTSEAVGRLEKVMEHRYSDSSLRMVQIGLIVQTPAPPPPLPVTPIYTPLFRCGNEDCEDRGIDLKDDFTCTTSTDIVSDPAEPGGTIHITKCVVPNAEDGPCLRVQGWNDSYIEGFNSLVATGVSVLVDSQMSKIAFCSE